MRGVLRPPGVRPHCHVPLVLHRGASPAQRANNQRVPIALQLHVRFEFELKNK